MNVLIIDADSIIHVASLKETLDEATHYVDEKIQYLHNFLWENHSIEVDQEYIVLGGADNFRKLLSPKYKSTRKPKPELYFFVKAWAMQNLGCIESKMVEADDVIAAIAKREKSLKNNVIVASLDKDLRQIYDVHFFNMHHTKFTLEFVTEIEAYRQHYKLMLMGDSSDVIAGLGGIGEKKATQALEYSKSEFGMRRVVVEMYKKHIGRKWREKYILAKTLITLRDDEKLIPEQF